jgi:hypothetical protein
MHIILVIFWHCLKIKCEDYLIYLQESADSCLVIRSNINFDGRTEWILGAKTPLRIASFGVIIMIHFYVVP